MKENKLLRKLGMQPSHVVVIPSIPEVVAWIVQRFGVYYNHPTMGEFTEEELSLLAGRGHAPSYALLKRVGVVAPRTLSPDEVFKTFCAGPVSLEGATLGRLTCSPEDFLSGLMVSLGEGAREIYTSPLKNGGTLWICPIAEGCRPLFLNVNYTNNETN